MEQCKLDTIPPPLPSYPVEEFWVEDASEASTPEAEDFQVTPGPGLSEGNLISATFLYSINIVATMIHTMMGQSNRVEDGKKVDSLVSQAEIVVLLAHLFKSMRCSMT